MKMLEVFAETSESKRLKVAAMLFKDGATFFGVNGTPAGWNTNVCEAEDGSTAWYTRHAEIACLDKIQRSTESTIGAEMMITHKPCLPCCIKIVEAGIKKVYYRHEYRCNSGVEYLLSKDVTVVQI